MLHNLTGHSLLDTNEDDQVFNAVHSVDFSPDGTLLATSGADGTAQLWRVADGTRVRVLSGVGNRYGSAVRFTADGKAVFTVGDGTIKLWRVTDGRLLATFENLSAQRLDVCSDHKHFAYGAGGTVVLARVPLWMEKIEQTGNQLILGWQGGSGLYQLQSTTNVVSGPWENVGTPTAATATTHAVTGTIFYRVQSLPNP